MANPVTFNGVVLLSGGKPIEASDLANGAEYEVDLATGEISQTANVVEQPEGADTWNRLVVKGTT